MKTRKILIQRIAASDPKSPVTRKYGELLLKNADMVKEEGTKISLRLLKRGLNSLREFAYSSLHYINDREVFEAVLIAEKDGFDAVIVYCFSDPALDEMRQAVNIPVIGLGQSSMMVAGIMGAKFGLVAMSEASVARNELLARRYGFGERVVLPIRPLPLPLEEQGKMITDASVGLDAFKAVAKAYVEGGAEVLLAACGALNLALRFCPGCSEFPNGFTEFEGVPIVDSVGAAVKIAEMMVDLKQAGSPWISRKGMYCQPSQEIRNEAVKKVGYAFGGIV